MRAGISTPPSTRLGIVTVGSIAVNVAADHGAEWPAAAHTDGQGACSAASTAYRLRSASLKRTAVGESGPRCGAGRHPRLSRCRRRERRRSRSCAGRSSTASGVGCPGSSTVGWVGPSGTSLAVQPAAEDEDGRDEGDDGEHRADDRDEEQQHCEEHGDQPATRAASRGSRRSSSTSAGGSGGRRSASAATQLGRRAPVRSAGRRRPSWAARHVTSPSLTREIRSSNARRPVREPSRVHPRPRSQHLAHRRADQRPRDRALPAPRRRPSCRRLTTRGALAP